MIRRRKEDSMVFLLSMSSGITFVYISPIAGTFMILGSFMISLFKKEIYHHVFE